MNSLAPKLSTALTLTLLCVIKLLVCSSLLAEEKPNDLLYQENLVYGKADDVELKLTLARPDNDQVLPAIVFIHGGGWCMGNKEHYTRLIKEAARQDFVAITVGYRLMEFDKKYQETTTALHNFPCQVHDVKAAVRWLRANADKYHVDTDHIGATGQSAGGHLSLMLGLTDVDDQLEGNNGSPEQSSRVQAVVNYFGPTDMKPCHQESSVGWVFRLFLNGTPEETPEIHRLASPITYVTQDDPPVLTLQGRTDKLVPFSQATVLDEKMKAAGVAHTLIEYETQGHGFDKQHKPLAEKAMFDFFKTHLKNEKTETE